MGATLLIVPGLRDHDPHHWQSLLAAERPGSRIVPALAENRLSRAARVQALDRALAEMDGPVILVAHSAGVLATVHWAQTARRPIRGALLATPADIETPLPKGYPAMADLEAGGWLPIPRSRLPFPAIVAASVNDPLASMPRVQDLARAWGARFVPAGAVGHLNPAAGFGHWGAAATLVDILDAEGRSGDEPFEPGLAAC